MTMIPKYASLEHERRFLVAEYPDISTSAARYIEDLYIDAGRLRLRVISDGVDTKPTFKLCKKYPSDKARSTPIVNIYLTKQEHAVLSLLPGHKIRKKRYRLREKGNLLGLDVFEGKLAGLILAEFEAASAAEVDALTLPLWAHSDVTKDPFFTGGKLARSSAVELRDYLSACWVAQLNDGSRPTPCICT